MHLQKGELPIQDSGLPVFPDSPDLPCKIIMHNDDYTTKEFALDILKSVLN